MNASDRRGRGPLRRLIRHARAHRGRLIAAATCSVSKKIFDLAPPGLIGAAVDVVVEREASLLARAGVVDVKSQLIVLAAITIVIWGLESLFDYLASILWRNLAQTVQHELRIEAYGHIQDLDVAWFAERSSGGLLAVLNDDVNQLERFLDGGADDILQVATTVIVISGVYFVIAPGVAALSMLPIPLILIGSFLFQARIAPRYAVVRDRVGKLNAVLANNLTGIDTIKSFTAEAREVDRVREASREYQEANRRAIALSSAFSPLIRMVIVGGFTATLVYGGLLALDGVIAVGAYGVLVFLTQRLLWPLTRLGATFDLYQRAMASTTRILDLIDTPIAIEDGTRTLDRAGAGDGARRGELRFEGVSFAYAGRAPALDGLDLVVPAGATVAVVGPTGAGKTTLVRLLLRFHDPAAGAITLDGVPLRELALASLRGAVSLVAQGTYLFPGTVRENVAYGRPDATDAEIARALRLAEAEAFVAELPDGLETVVGEHGRKLSGGQAQRISIARAVLKDAPVLVLDEATSAVDNETEAAIQRSLRRIARERTTLVIAHRLSTIRHADAIVVLDRGRVVERGTHDELVVGSGLYARLWRVQTGEVLPEEEEPVAALG